MKIYITSRFKGAVKSKDQIEELCRAVRGARMEDFHFIRDVERYQPNFFESQKQLWIAAREHLADCDALLIDVSDMPSGGRLVEAGMAYAMCKPIYVLIKNNIDYQDFYDGIATAVIKYDDIHDITEQLKSFIGHA